MKWFLVFAKEKGEKEVQLLFKLLSREDAEEAVKLLVCDWGATSVSIEESDEEEREPRHAALPQKAAAPEAALKDHVLDLILTATEGQARQQGETVKALGRINRRLDYIMASQQQILEAIAQLAEAGVDGAKLAALSTQVNEKATQLRAALDAAQAE